MRRLFVYPAVALALFVAGQLLFAGQASAVHVFNRVEVLAAGLLATLGCEAAATAFQRGDYLRLAWRLNGVSYLPVAINAALTIPAAPTRPLMEARALSSVVANVLGVASMWLFARTYRVAGLVFPGSKARKAAFVALAALLAVAVAGLPFILDLRQGMSGDIDAVTRAISSIGDIATFILIAPVVMTALALRGGLLVWPWSLFAAANIAWLLFDAQDTVTYFVPNFIGVRLEQYSEPWRVLACMLTFCAGLAMRRLSLGEEEQER